MLVPGLTVMLFTSKSDVILGWLITLGELQPWCLRRAGACLTNYRCYPKYHPLGQSKKCVSWGGGKTRAIFVYEHPQRNFCHFGGVMLVCVYNQIICSMVVRCEILFNEKYGAVTSLKERPAIISIYVLCAFNNIQNRIIVNNVIG